jgi:hypothetical protein
VILFWRIATRRFAIATAAAVAHLLSLLYLSEVLAKEPVGLKPIDDQRWEVRYSFHLLGVLDERNKSITPAKGWHGAKCSKV